MARIWLLKACVADTGPESAVNNEPVGSVCNSASGVYTLICLLADAGCLKEWLPLSDEDFIETADSEMSYPTVDRIRLRHR